MNFGTIDLKGGFWHIQCEPHVKTRLKRVFPNVAQHAADVIQLSDTPGNSRELAWFLERFPMEVSNKRHLKKRAQQHQDLEVQWEALLQGTVPTLSVALTKPARDYQLQVPAALNIKQGLLLGDELGVGKTVSAICAMVEPGAGPIVVVYPAYMLDHWPKKLKEFAPELRVHQVRKSEPYNLLKSARSRQTDLWPDKMPDVIAISYHKLRGWAETLAKFCRFVVFDEVQQLRHPDSQIYQACKYLAGKSIKRLGLSATPVFNVGSEMFWIIDVLSPDALGTWEEFNREWCAAGASIDKTRLKDPVAFGNYLRREGIMLRRTRKDVGRELPKVQNIVHTVDTDQLNLENLAGDAMALAKIIVANNERYRGEKMQAAGEFDMLMRQATGIAKAPYVAEFVRLICESGNKVILFGWHRQVYNIWLERLADLKPMLYSGSETPTQKMAAKEAFINGDCQVLIMSLRSGAGIDGLQEACSTVIHGELDWSPMVHEQCTGRVDRDGQPIPVVAYYLVSDEGSDPVITDVLGLKRDQIEGVMDPDQNIRAVLDVGERQLRAVAEQFLAKHKQTQTQAAIFEVEEIA